MNSNGERVSTSDNFIERYHDNTGNVVIDMYINSPYGTFVSFFHVLVLASEKDIVNIYMNSGIYSEDASLLLGSMDLCKAPINVYVGLVEGFYGACIVAKADKRVYTDMSGVALNTPKEFFTLRGLGSIEQQVTYMKNSVDRFVGLIIESGLSTREEIDEIILKNKYKLLKREDLAERLSDKSLE